MFHQSSSKVARTALASISGIALILSLSACGGQTKSDAESTKSTPSTSATQKPNMTFNVTPDKAPESNDKDANIIMDVTPKDNKAKAFAHAVAIDKAKATASDAKYPATVTVPTGEYTVKVIGTINPDGSITKPSVKDTTVTVTDTNGSKKADKSDNSVNTNTTTIPADKVTPEQIKEIVDQTAEAIKKGDQSLTGDNGKAVADRLADNTKNTKVPEETKKEVADKATEAGNTAQTTQPSTPAQPVTPAKPVDNGAKPGTTGGNTQPVCTPQTREVPVYEDVWVPEVTKTEQYVIKDAWDETVTVAIHIRINEIGTTTTISTKNPGWKNEALRWIMANDADDYGYEITYDHETVHHDAEYGTRTVVITPGHNEKRQTGTRTETINSCN